VRTVSTATTLDARAACVPRTSGAAALAAAAAAAAHDRADLERWLAIPSVSANPRLAGEVDRAACWLAARLRALGAGVRRLPTPGGPPVVVGRVPGPAGAPSVLVYGHYDVRPAGRGWRTDPFGPERRGDVIYARGANDDKGQLLAHIAALAAWQRVGGPPVAVTVVAEGAEEVGSRGFRGAVARLGREVRPDVVIVSDTERADLDTPAVVVSQRGTIVVELVVDVGGPPVHAGRLGGAVVDPSVVLTDGLLALRRGLPAWLPDRRRPPGNVRVRPDAAIRRAARGRAVTGRGLDRRITERPSLSVTDLRAGDGSGAVPTRAQARLDLRLPPGVESGPVLDQLRRTFRCVTPAGVRTEVRVLARSKGLRLVPPPWVRSALGDAARTGFGRPVVYLRSGGGIPAVANLRAVFGRDPVLLGLGTPAGNAHGPDEHLDLPGWHRSIRLCTALLDDLARRAPTPELTR
jgi:succinyl-diaminopimelate desuccinylase